MTTEQLIIDELVGIEAMASTLLQRSYKLRKRLGDVSTSPSKKKKGQLSIEQIDKALAKRRQHYIKKTGES